MTAIQRTMRLPTDASGKHINRAMGVPLVSYNKYLGSATYPVDLINLDTSNTNDRVLNGIHIKNPSAAATVYLCLTDAFGTDVAIACPPQTNLVFDSQSFGPGIDDETLGKKVTKVRAYLSLAVGVLATGTIDYSGSGNPTDGQQFTINGVTYEFTNDGSPTSDTVVPIAVGVSADASWTNTVAAINGYDQAITATINTGTDILTITSNYGGITGNLITLADVTTGATFSGATLTGGLGGVLPIVHVW